MSNDETSQSGVVTGSLDALSPDFTGYTILPARSQQSMNVLYRARRYGRYYVLKGLAQEFRNDPVRREYLSKEYQIGVQLDHPHIVRVNSLEEDSEAGLCIVMEYVDGMSLDKWLETNPSASDKKRIFLQILDAIGYCHDHQVWHLDLKPSNILITNDGFSVKIIDFGLSDNSNFVFKQVGGTRKYAAPEQLNGSPVDHRSDIYALGGILKLLFPHRYRYVVRAAQKENPDKRPQSVSRLAKMIRPRWYLWLLPLLLIVLVCLWMRPNGEKFLVTFESGQTVYARVLSHWKRTVAIVSPLDANGNIIQGWHDIPNAPAGDMVIPSHIKHRHLPYRVLAIDTGAFAQCDKLQHLVLSEGIESLGKLAFCACNHISDTVVIPRSLKKIEPNVFDDCHSITLVVWKPLNCYFSPTPNTLTPFFYRCSSLTKVIVDDSVQSLPPCLFSDMSWLKEIVLPDHIEVIPSDFMPYDYSLAHIKLPDSLKEISHAAFYMSNLENLVIPDKTKIIGSYSFSYCRSLREVVIGSGVKTIETYAFNELKALETMTVHCEEPPTMMLNALYMIPETAVLRVPACSLEKYRSHPVWSIFKRIEAIEPE
ncbi:MAG: leucine-rich repeat protein [Bacteroidales bacterium]|nr:leucine-rich repeat protein [Bacteroidales bacterium]